MQTVSKFRGIVGLQEARSKINTKRFSIVPPTVGLVFALLSHFFVLTPLSAAASSPPVVTEWQLYEPVAEVVVPTGDVNIPRAVEEKDGYVYLLAREGILYTYDISDLPLQQAFTTYNTPVYKQTLYSGNGNGLLRHGNYLYVFGRNGIQTIDVQNPGMPAPLDLKNDLNIYNMVRHENYLIAAGQQRIAVYSIDEPSNPTFLSDLNMGEEQLVWSAAVYGSTLYACNWTSDWQGSYTNYLSIIDFSNPAGLSVLNTISRDDQAYHLRVIGNQLVECTSNQVRLWDLTTPADPVLLASQQAGGRVCALDGDNIVTNGTVLRPNGNELQIITTFTSGGSQRDGYPYGSAVNASFVFIAQHQRILILNASMPPLSVNHASGGPGSFFTITGHGFPSNSTATFVANSYTLGDVATDAAGDCLFLLSTEQADEGRYVVTATLDPSASTSFVIASGESVYPQEGSGTIFQIPSGIAYSTYSGGTGEPNDPYQIATAADLIALGETPEDYDKHFLLTADIDLDPNLPGSRVFDKAIIAAAVSVDKSYRLQGLPFTGTFDGNRHMILHLTITGQGCLGLFGGLGPGGEVRNLGVVDVNVSASGNSVAGLVGLGYGTVTQSYATGEVSGTGIIGGLVGTNRGTVIQCYSSGKVDGENLVGGLVGTNSAVLLAVVSNCYSSALVSGNTYVGGLVGLNGSMGLYGRLLSGTIENCLSVGSVSGTGGGLVGGTYHTPSSTPAGLVICSFWDVQTSGQAMSEGGTGKTTAEMQTASTFLNARWDFVDETANGTEDIWWILEGQDYPHLWWEAE